MKSLNWLLSAALLAGTCLRPTVRAEIVIDDRGSSVTSTGNGNAPVQAVADAGTQVEAYKPPAEEENKWLPWVLGGAAALAALVGGILIADAGDSDSGAAEAAAADAAGGAAAAEAAAAAAAAQTAAAEAAALDAQVAATQEVADQINAANAGPKTKAFVSGAWVGTPMTVTCGMSSVSFTPRIQFTTNQLASPGGVLSYQTKCTGGAGGGSWTAIENTSQISILVDESFYVGRATVYAPDRIILANGAVLQAVSGSGFAVLQSLDP